MLVDPDGRDVHPADSDTYIVLLNTISPDERQFVVLNHDGNIDYDTMLSHKSESENYSKLLTMSGSDITYNIYLQADYSYKDNNGKIIDNNHLSSEYEEGYEDTDFLNTSGLTTGETGRYGISLLPGKGTSGVNSLDNSAHIYIAPSLSTIGRAEALSHELYGHGYLYDKYRDRNKSKHDNRNTMIEYNDELRNHILRARKETVSYFNYLNY